MIRKIIINPKLLKLLKYIIIKSLNVDYGYLNKNMSMQIHFIVAQVKSIVGIWIKT